MSSPRHRRVGLRAAAGVLLVGAVYVTSACGPTVENLPLPKPSVGDSYTVHAVFENALNLPASAKVRVGGSDVGMVSDISTKNFTADVTMQIRKDVQLPTTSTAELRQATPLGDEFVAMSIPPKQPGQQYLKDGDTIGLQQTSAGATVEELLTSLSMLLNGGGLSQLNKLVSETDSIVGGRGPEISHLIVEMTNIIASLNAQTARIDGTLNGLDATLGTMNRNRDELGRVADALPPMIGTLAENNQAIGDVLAKVSLASAALGDFSKTTHDQLSQLLDNTTKLMNGLSQMGDNLGAALAGVHEVAPKANASMEGPVLAVAATVSYLSVGALSDPKGSRVPDGSDVTNFVGSLVEVLEKVQQRLHGGTR